MPPVSSVLNPPAPSRLSEFDRSKFYQLLPQDAIRPIYDPQFTGVRGAKLFDDDLILGVEINGEAKAYPIPSCGSARSSTTIWEACRSWSPGDRSA